MPSQKCQRINVLNHYTVPQRMSNSPPTPQPHATTEKLDKEKSRVKELEEAKQEQQAVINKMTREMQKMQERSKSEKASSDQKSQQRWEEEKVRLLEDHRLQMEDLSRREEQYAAEIIELQNEINDLINEQTTHENEYNLWEDEKEKLIQRFNSKSDELQRAMEDLEQLNAENAEYLQKIDDYESSMGTPGKDEFEQSHVRSR